MLPTDTAAHTEKVICIKGNQNQNLGTEHDWDFENNVAAIWKFFNPQDLIYLTYPVYSPTQP